MEPYWKDITMGGKPWSWRPYPNISTRPDLRDSLTMRETQWFRFFGYIEDFLDRHLNASNNTLLHGREGCVGPAAAAMAYIMKKVNASLQDVWESVVPKRPCIEEIKEDVHPTRMHLQWLHL